MHKASLVTIVVLLTAAFAVAQMPSAPSQAPGARPSQTSPTNPNQNIPPDQAAPPGGNSQASPAGAENSVEGCLGGSVGSFTITDKTGTAYQLQLPPTADASKISQHVGEEIRVSGAMAGKNAIQVTKMSKIGEKCGAAGSTPSK